MYKRQVLAQPGGYPVWSAASRAESRGALSSTSILDHASGGRVNLGTFAAYTTLALAPLAALALVSAAGLGARALVRRVRSSGPAPIEREQPFTRLKPSVDRLVNDQTRRCV